MYNVPWLSYENHIYKLGRIYSVWTIWADQGNGKEMSSVEPRYAEIMYI